MKNVSHNYDFDWTKNQSTIQCNDAYTLMENSFDLNFFKKRIFIWSQYLFLRQT